MRLDGIKLTGFKSFVDPTSIAFPGNRCAVVGPNGCGKSNIIDAVRWVMGESSALKLRGESIADVIFKGSNSRNATAMASIELSFDNTDGRLGGEYASFGRIAVRRELTRDAHSTYYLNGNRCRRRDIVDVFLGTGFGPRGYSIIEQGMIGELVEARPEDLRAYLEESAGISKYRERRRETENRMRRATENLDRLRDIRQELEDRLRHLQRQARAAARYRELKREERLRTAELLVLRIRDMNADLEERDRALKRLEVEHDQALSGLRRDDANIERARAEQQEHSDASNRIQGLVYKIGAKIGETESAIRFNRQRQEQLEDDLQGAQRRLEEIVGQIENDKREAALLEAAIAAKVPELDEARKEDGRVAEALATAEDDMRASEARWSDFVSRASANDRELRVEENRVEHIQQNLDRLRQRFEQLEEQNGEYAFPTDDLAGELDEAERRHDLTEAELETCATELASAREAIVSNENALQAARAETQGLRNEFAALDALQQAALGQENHEAQGWIDALALDRAPRLGAELIVEPGWERAVETVLGTDLGAIRVEDIGHFADDLCGLQAGRVVLYEGQEIDPSPNGQQLPPLAALVGTDRGPVGAMLAGVFAAETLDVALAHRCNLKSGESIVTRDAVWLGVDWVRVNRTEDAALGVVERAQDLDNLGARLVQADRKVAELAGLVTRGRQHVVELDGRRDRLQHRYRECSDLLSHLRTEQGVRRVRMEEAAARQHRAESERDEIVAQVASEMDRKGGAQTRLASLKQEARTLETERAELGGARARQAQRLETARKDAAACRSRLHALQVEYEHLTTKLSAAGTVRSRLHDQRSELETLVRDYRDDIASNLKPLPALETSLQEKLREKVGVDRQLAAIHRRVEEAENATRGHEQQRQESNAAVERARSRLHAAQVEREGVSARYADLSEQLGNTGVNVDEVSAALPEDADEGTWRERMERIERQIKRLGAVNLAALEELETQSERKRYLDAQNEDLERALSTLRAAIERIDRETRTRFKSTFDAVNEHLKNLFPKLFGGGHAYLELTGDNLLDAGVSLMARPPGKRNSGIQMLSGGEKAMTAIALVFAIFQLNPSPVCLLDEVDAPLDDTNVVRFAELLEEMSSEVQFVVVTHNKLTMEMADQLLGVTMNEPGVSRLVSVDLDEAAAMAAV